MTVDAHLGLKQLPVPDTYCQIEYSTAEPKQI